MFFFFQDCFSSPDTRHGIVSEVADNLVFRMAQNLYNLTIRVIINIQFCPSRRHGSTRIMTRAATQLAAEPELNSLCRDKRYGTVHRSKIVRVQIAQSSATAFGQNRNLCALLRVFTLRDGRAYCAAGGQEGEDGPGRMQCWRVRQLWWG